MTWQLVRLADATPSPWRNGGGVTSELAAWPSAGEWIWRISAAEVAASGPFSRFPGVQRWFAVLNGQGVRLKLPHTEHELTRASSAFQFKGELAVDCELRDGPTQDLNLMVRRDRAQGRMERIAGVQPRQARPGMVLALYAVDGPARITGAQGSLAVPAHSLAWRAVPAAVELQVTTPGALWMEIEQWA
jgi:uncharacterized protein